MQPEDLMLLVSKQMPFGKHKGTIIADLPGNYLHWFAREGAKREFAPHASRRRNRLAVQSQPWAAKRTGGVGLLQFAFRVFHHQRVVIAAISVRYCRAVGHRLLQAVNRHSVHKDARGVFGDAPLYPLMGGFHPAGRTVEPAIPETVGDLMSFGLKHIPPADALQRMARLLSNDESLQ